MALNLEANRALKDMIIRSDFRLVDVEVRSGNVSVRERVSTLLQRQLGAAEQQQQLIDRQVLPPGVFPLGGTGPGLPLLDGNGAGAGPSIFEGAGDVLGSQVYTVRGANSPNNVIRTIPISIDGVLTRASGGVVSLSDLSEFDEGIRLLLSDVNVDTSVDRVSGDRDLFSPQIGVQTTGRHGIGVSQEVTAVGHASVDNFSINFNRPVRAGQRLGVDLNGGAVERYWVAFEVTQFAPVRDVVRYIGERIVESARVDPAPAAFSPVIMQETIERPGGRVVQSLSEVNRLLKRGWIIVGNVFSDGIFPT